MEVDLNPIALAWVGGGFVAGWGGAIVYYRRLCSLGAAAKAATIDPVKKAGEKANGQGRGRSG